MMRHLEPGFGPLELEQLDEKERDGVRGHLAACAECAVEYRLSAEALASVALSLPPTPPPPSLRTRLLESLGSTNRFEMFATVVADLVDVSVERAKEIVRRIDDATVWMATHVPGVSSYDLPVGPALHDAVVGFIRVRAGHVFPDHEHMGDETMLVVQGSCVESDGNVRRRGDLVRQPPKTHHELKARPGPDFIYLGIVKDGFVMFGEHIKPGDRRG
jgi:anti-sigma factor ChrR (cupin superfamily)